MRPRWARRGLLLTLAFGTGAAAVLSCQSGPEITYAGREHERAVEPEAVALLAGRLPPEGYTIIGVVTARCTLVDGASGLLAESCDDDTLTMHLRERAAAVGGTALLDLACERKETDRDTQTGDAGTVTVSVRETLTCQGTALRHEGRRPEIEVTKTPDRRVTIGGIEVAIEITREDGEKPRPARSEDEVGELENFPDEHHRLARITATCLSGCSRNTARLAIRKEAARLGAIAFAELRCDLDDDRWRCNAVAVGE